MLDRWIHTLRHCAYFTVREYIDKKCCYGLRPSLSLMTIGELASQVRGTIKAGIELTGDAE